MLQTQRSNYISVTVHEFFSGPSDYILMAKKEMDVTGNGVSKRFDII